MAAFFVRSAATGAANGTSWTDAYTTIALALAGSVAAGDTIWVADDHAESTPTTSVVWTFPGTQSSPNRLFVVDHTQASPGTGDLKIGTLGAGSAITTTTAGLTQAGTCHFYGLYMSAGSGANGVNLILNNSASRYCRYERCTFVVAGTSGGSIFQSAASGRATFVFCTARFSNVASQFTIRGQARHIGSVFADTGTVPTTLLSTVTMGRTEFEICDLSALSGKTLVGDAAGIPGLALFNLCKLPASVTISATQTGAPGYETILIRCDSGANNYRTERYDGLIGNHVTNTSVIRTGGAAQSWKWTTVSGLNWYQSLRGLPISIQNATTGSTVAVVLEGVADPRSFSALPNNDDFWFDVEYMGDAGSPLGSLATGTKANILATGSALTASTQAWDSAASARANTTAYVLGDVIKLASNPGRIFICTTAGTTAGSEPGGYATAVDGGAVTDNTAVFTAAWRFKQTVTTGTVQIAGPLTIYPRMAKSTAVVYLDPQPTISGQTVKSTYPLWPGVLQNDVAGGGHIASRQILGM